MKILVTVCGVCISLSGFWVLYSYMSPDNGLTFLKELLSTRGAAESLYIMTLYDLGSIFLILLGIFVALFPYSWGGE